MSELISTDAFRNAMSRLGAAVTIITTDGSAGLHGLTASAVCSVTDQPPTLLVCINRRAGAHDAIVANGVLCVNLLTGQHIELANRFGKSGISVEDRYSFADWKPMVTGAPVLVGAAVSFDCRIVNRQTVGTHSVLFCELMALDTATSPQGLVYFNRNYHSLGEKVLTQFA